MDREPFHVSHGLRFCSGCLRLDGLAPGCHRTSHCFADLMRREAAREFTVPTSVGPRLSVRNVIRLFVEPLDVELCGGQHSISTIRDGYFEAWEAR